MTLYDDLGVMVERFFDLGDCYMALRAANVAGAAVWLGEFQDLPRFADWLIA